MSIDAAIRAVIREFTDPLAAAIEGQSDINAAQAAVNDAVLARLDVLEAGTAPEPAPPPQAGIYGPGIGATSLANTTIGNRAGSIRFRAERSGKVTHARWYCKTGGDYSGGSGWRYELQVQGDASGKPDGVVLGTTGAVDIGSNAGLNMAFTQQPTLEEGRLYHLVFRNRHASPAANYVSVNSFLDSHEESPWFPRWPGNDHVFLYSNAALTSWTERPAYGPIYDLTFADGGHQGMGYMEMDNAAGTAGATATRMFRERFTAKGSRSIRRAGIHVRKAAGTAPLVVALRDGSGARGNVLGAFEIPAVSIGSAERWVAGEFPAPLVLADGQAYRLEFSTSGNGDYTSRSIRRGTQYGYHPGTCFEGGIGEQWNGTSWTSLPNQSGAGSQMDIQCYMQGG